MGVLICPIARPRQDSAAVGLQPRAGLQAPRAYLEQIFAGLRDAGLPVFHVVLDAEEDILRERIQGSPEAQSWRPAHLAEYRASRSWMIPAADLVVDIGRRTPSAAAHQIADALPEL